MTVQTTVKVIAFMEKYNKHFEELCAFVSEKKAKVIADELTWLLDSLNVEQKFVMEGNDLEAKRLALFEELGLSGAKAKQHKQKAAANRVLSYFHIAYAPFFLIVYLFSKTKMRSILIIL